MAADIPVKAPVVAPVMAPAVYNWSGFYIGGNIGGGVEVGLTPNWSAKAEYLYVRLEDRSYVLTGVNNGFSSNVFRLGVNYRF